MTAVPAVTIAEIPLAATLMFPVLEISFIAAVAFVEPAEFTAITIAAAAGTAVTLAVPLETAFASALLLRLGTIGTFTAGLRSRGLSGCGVGAVGFRSRR